MNVEYSRSFLFRAINILLNIHYDFNIIVYCILFYSIIVNV